MLSSVCLLVKLDAMELFVARINNSKSERDDHTVGEIRRDACRPICQRRRRCGEVAVKAYEVLKSFS